MALYRVDERVRKMNPVRLFEVLWRPRTALARAAEGETSLGDGAAAMMVLALPWSAFCWWLYRDGQRPSFVGWPVPADDYYLWQALFLAPLLLALWTIYSAVASLLARRSGGRGGMSRTATVLGLAYGPPVLVTYILPDMLVYALLGFDALATVARICAPIAAFWVLNLSIRGLIRVHGLSATRTTLIVGLAFLVQAVFAAALIR